MGILNDRNRIEFETAKTLIGLCLLVYSSSLQPNYVEHDCLQGVWKMESTVPQNEISSDDVIYTFHATLHAGIHVHSPQPTGKEDGDSPVQTHEPGVLCPVALGFAGNVGLPR